MYINRPFFGHICYMLVEVLLSILCLLAQVALATTTPSRESLETSESQTSFDFKDALERLLDRREEFLSDSLFFNYLFDKVKGELSEPDTRPMNLVFLTALNSYSKRLPQLNSLIDFSLLTKLELI